MGFQGIKIVLMVVLVGGVQQLMAASTGKGAAMKYFSKKPSAQIRTSPAQTKPTGDSGLMAFSVGTLVSSKSYQWLGNDFQGWNVDIGYRPASKGYFGRSYHLEYQKFTDVVEELSKMSFLMSFSFPRRLSFPVYVGIAAGPGFFFKQKDDESEFTFDYKAYLGVRLNQAHSQYFIQSGVKNHVHMLSDGQFIGWFVSSGVAYKF